MYSRLVEATTRHPLSGALVPLFQLLWEIPVAHFVTPTTVRDLFVRYPDDIDAYRPTTPDVMCRPCDGFVRIVKSGDERVKPRVRVSQCCNWQAHSLVICFALYPHHFHHVFCPGDGVCTCVRFFRGKHRLDPTVDPHTNMRAEIGMRTTSGDDVTIVMVGALGVASICLHVHVGMPVFKGMHIGYFDVGGSCVLMALSPRKRLGTIVDSGRARGPLFQSCHARTHAKKPG